jgi:hypothetical protein
VDTVELNPENLNPLIPRARVSLSPCIIPRAHTRSSLTSARPSHRRATAGSPRRHRREPAPPPSGARTVTATGPRCRPGSPTPRSYSSSTHTSSRSRSDIGSFRRQESRRPPVAPHAPDKNKYASDSKREGITPLWLLVVCRQGPRLICSTEVSAAVHSPLVCPALSPTRLDDVQLAFCLVDSVVFPIKEP